MSYEHLSREDRRAIAKAIERENAKWPAELVALSAARLAEHASTAPPGWTPPARVWRSRTFLVQEFHNEHPLVLARLSVNRAGVAPDGRWLEGITWEELQSLKAQAGYGEHDAVEVYPADRDVTNVANMRHLWVLREAVAFKWKDND